MNCWIIWINLLKISNSNFIYINMLSFIVKNILNLQPYIFILVNFVFSLLNPNDLLSQKWITEVGLMIGLQFVLIHSGVFMSLGLRRRNDRLKNSILFLLFWTIFYLLFFLGIYFSSGRNSSVAILFVTIMLSRIYNLVISPNKKFASQEIAFSAFGAVIILATGLFSVFVWVPTLSLTDDILWKIIQDFNVDTNVERMRMLFYFGFIYFFLMALVSIYITNTKKDLSIKRKNE